MSERDPRTGQLIIRVVPSRLQWEVRVPGYPLRMIDRLCTEARAVEHAQEIAYGLAERLERAGVRIDVETADRVVIASHVVPGRRGGLRVA